MPNSNSSSSISNSTDKILIDLGYLEYGKGGKKKLFFQLVSNFQIKLRMVVIGEKNPIFILQPVRHHAALIVLFHSTVCLYIPIF